MRSAGAQESPPPGARWPFGRGPPCPAPWARSAEARAPAGNRESSRSPGGSWPAASASGGLEEEPVWPHSAYSRAAAPRAPERERGLCTRMTGITGSDSSAGVPSCAWVSDGRALPARRHGRCSGAAWAPAPSAISRRLLLVLAVKSCGGGEALGSRGPRWGAMGAEGPFAAMGEGNRCAPARCAAYSVRAGALTLRSRAARHGQTGLLTKRPRKGRHHRRIWSESRCSGLQSPRRRWRRAHRAAAT